MFEVFPRQSDTGGGLAGLQGTSLTKGSTRNFTFAVFEICEEHLSHDGHTAVILNFYHPSSRRQNT